MRSDRIRTDWLRAELSWPPMLHSGTFVVERTADEVFDLLANPERFAPLMPDFESMSMQDASHFTLRTAIALGSMQGHANLAMELSEAERPSRIGYSGEAIVAGGPLRLTVRFSLVPEGATTLVIWQGEVMLGGSLAFLAGSLLETIGRQNLERMAERIRGNLTPAVQPPTNAASLPDMPDYEI